MQINELEKYQPEVIKLLKNAYEKDKLNHAYLFEGDSGTGIYEAALYFAMMLLCEEENKPCFKCNICERIQYNSHLNVIVIEPINDVIRKEQIDNLMNNYNYTSLEKGSQIYIIKEADKMNTSAANSLLKNLEEPAPGHYTILLTSNHKRILDTIISRTQYIHFKPVGRTYIAKNLESSGVDKDLAYVISHVTSDSSAAKQFVEEGKMNLYINFAKKLVSAKYKKRNTYVDYFNGKSLLLEETDRSWQYIFFDILILIKEEIIKKVTNEDKYFSSVIDIIKDNTINIQEIIKELELLNEYQERLNSNVNLDLLYTSLFSQF